MQPAAVVALQLGQGPKTKRQCPSITLQCKCVLSLCAHVACLLVIGIDLWQAEASWMTSPARKPMAAQELLGRQRRLLLICARRFSACWGRKCVASVVCGVSPISERYLGSGKKARRVYLQPQLFGCASKSEIRANRPPPSRRVATVHNYVTGRSLESCC